MSPTICVCAKTLNYPRGGGNAWAFLNWARGLKSQGCTVIWAEKYAANEPEGELMQNIALLRARLIELGLTDGIALLPDWEGAPAPARVAGCLTAEEAAERSDLLVNFAHACPDPLIPLFRRSALIDIDPGLLQFWAKLGALRIPRHDYYFTIGENVGAPGGSIPDLGLDWIYCPPCISLEWWPPAPTEPDAPFTTVTHWSGPWMADDSGAYPNDKRSGFLPYLKLPRMTNQPLELAVYLAPNEADERVRLERNGWRVRDSQEVAGSPFEYRRYVQTSRGEFSCAKPSCVRLQNAWVSDRTLCYLVSAKPAVVQHTGPSRFLPDAQGLLRFRDPPEAARLLEAVAAHYGEHAAAARQLAEEHFDARKVAAGLLDRTLG
jgi:hypothetical protein